MPESRTPTRAPDADRLRALTGAVIAVGAGLELPEVLQRLVTTAATLTGARYAALGIAGDRGGLVEFITHGVTPELRRRLGGMPQAHGIPGLLLRGDTPALRLEEISAHPGSVGFPRDHPPMRTFLGVPVRVHGRMFGNLYVADKQAESGPALFTGEDEESMLALGAAAGVAIENARLYAAADERRRWSDAAGAAGHAVIAATSADLLERLAEVPGIARAASHADLALLAAERDGRWRVVHADGEGAAQMRGQPLAGPLVGLAGHLEVARVLEPDEVAALPGQWTQAEAVPVPGPPDHPGALLVLARHRPASFAESPPDTVGQTVFGQRLGMALAVARAHLDAAQVSLLRDRDRIARDLHDHVIQRLFAVGLSLQAALVAARVPEVRTRLGRAVEDIDATIKDIRRTIFGLHGSAIGDDLRERLEEVVAEAAEGLAATPQTFVEGPLSAVPAPLAADIVAVVREALSNVVRHARAARVEVFVSVAGRVEIEVVDDGVGIAGRTRRSGLANLCRRAEQRGGTCVLEKRPGGGTVLRWTVPLPGPAR